MTPSPNHQKQSGKAEEWEARFNEKFIEKDLQMEKEGHVIRANKNLVLLFEIETFIRQELSRQREEIRESLPKYKPMPDYGPWKYQRRGFNKAIYQMRKALAIIGGEK